MTPPRFAWLRAILSRKHQLTCQETVELVTAYLEGTLDAATLSRFEAHLASCDGCSTYLEELRIIVHTIGAIGVDDIDPIFRDRLMDAFAESSGSW